MLSLARMYAEGLGLPKDAAEAVRLYEQAAEAGEFLAQIELGRIYSRGSLVPADSGLALRWYSAAAEQKGRVLDDEKLPEAKSYVSRAPHVGT